MTEPLVLTLTSFSRHGDERVRSIKVPPTFQGQQSLSFAGWDIVVFDDGTMEITRDSAVTSAVARPAKASEPLSSVIRRRHDTSRTVFGPTSRYAPR